MISSGVFKRIKKNHTPYGRVLRNHTFIIDIHEYGGVDGTVASESALRSAGNLPSRVRALPPTPWPEGRPQSLRSPCCELALYNKSISYPWALKLHARELSGNPRGYSSDRKISKQGAKALNSTEASSQPISRPVLSNFRPWPGARSLMSNLPSCQ
ncbi:hypothetical protein PoB_005532100 [Plakobranchus ocellatus]|uniref:Uncharacterized protein n=1 Tax=Plakobranchus ocellatus TaxID=259542 RepID=A0AAV4CBT1_9GAST|nr:hypothetical protein PoB_005532100 [Plakobranchus ocellatus]